VGIPCEVGSKASVVGADKPGRQTAGDKGKRSEGREGDEMPKQLKKFNTEVWRPGKQDGRKVRWRLVESPPEASGIKVLKWERHENRGSVEGGGRTKN